MTLIFSFVCEYVKERRKALIKLRPQQSFNYTQFANYLAPYNFVKKKIIIIIIRKKKKKKTSVSDPSLVGHSHPLSSAFSEVKKNLFVYFLNKLDNLRYYDYYLCRNLFN